MTAIAGMWRLDGRRDAGDACTRMLAGLHLHGPERSDALSEHELALGRNLLRTLPEDRFDNQPLVGRQGRFVLVADLRLDNRDELIASLKIAPEAAGSQCDAQVLLAAIERWEDGVFERIVGDYAFAAWDKINRTLLLARDPLGWRPLHFHKAERFFAFASMPKGLHALPEIRKAPDEQRLTEWLVQLPPRGSQSFFAEISSVEAGHFVRVSRQGITSGAHWTPVRKPIRFSSSDQYAEALRAHLDTAVKCRLRGAGDIGVYMSGGLDSTTVAATAARLLAGTNRRVVAYTSVPREGYDGKFHPTRFIDESGHAAAVAAMYSNMDHILVRSDGTSPLDRLDALNYFYEVPVPNLCNIGWLQKILENMRDRKISVALYGDMGNVGLSYAGSELLPELVSQGRWFSWLREARALVGPDGMRWRGALALTFGPWLPVSVWVWLNRIATGYAPSVPDYSPINPTHLTAHEPLGMLIKSRWAESHQRPRRDAYSMRVDWLRSVDLGNLYAGNLARCRVDERDPTSDIRLIEFCLNIPTEQFLSNGVQRALARRAFGDRLPQKVVNETRAGLQAADWHEGLTAAREQIQEEISRLEANPVAARSLDLDRLRELTVNWPTEGWEKMEILSKYQTALGFALSTGRFLRYAQGGNL